MLTMTHRESRTTWWNRIAGSLAAAAGLLAAGAGVNASPIAAERSDYRPADAVPPAWQAFARQLKHTIEQRLAADDEKARHFQEYLDSRIIGGDVPPVTLLLRAWVSSDGRLHRVEFDGLSDPRASVDLRALLTGQNVGVPPPEMLQPLHLRFSLRATDRLQQEK
ncbi:hypothetical protein QA649_29085 [Bradyrhizobium sp. CB1717]|uniref:hypothetical protein n=1 Tax=Bradyrhizobium sp. CB1717 TaxID=3039154 RepID=UPI0024B1DAF8|nr:hypothetical protein [Bradyrhizobium sp. CB1717]WFU22130.1 hypothetical protein QA649_29085 [Bradyrhizobium sp. CB1717]